MKTIILEIALALVLAICLSSCGKPDENKKAVQKTVKIPAPLLLPKEPEDLSLEQPQWQVYLCPGMPQPYIEVLKQYEQFMNADNQDINEESVQAKLWDGEWKYLYDELCMSLPFILENDPSQGPNYALADLTGDGYPEMIMAYGNDPRVIYHYSDTHGIGMEHASSYYCMTIYQNGIVEYVSGGAYSSTTYLQFQEDLQCWNVADIIGVYGTWDSENEQMNDTDYYGGDWGDDGWLDETITEEEYRKIQETYVTEPMEFEWIPLLGKCVQAFRLNALS